MKYNVEVPINKRGKQTAYQGRFSEYADVFETDGVVIVRNALGVENLTNLEEAFTARLRDPVTTARLYPEDETILQSHGNSINDPAIEALMRDSPIADIAWGLFRGRNVWYWSEQAWLKQGGEAPRTPWHQDMSYVPFAGSGFAVLWIPLDSLAAVNALEAVRGSHRGPLYNGTLFKPGDDTAPLYDERDLPRLPDIEAERSQWDIFSADLSRGDVMVFHPACLHGGAPTFRGQRRRAMSFRFFSDDVVYKPLPKVRDDGRAQTQSDRKEKLVTGFEKLSPGDPIHLSKSYRKIRPWDKG